MAYFDTRTGHALLGYVPTFGRYTMGATPDYSIENISVALMNEIGNIKLPLSKISIGLFRDIKIEEIIPDELEVVVKQVVASSFSKYVKTQLELSKEATAETVSDAISADVTNKIRPKLMDYFGVDKNSPTQMAIFQTSVDLARTSLKSIIKTTIVKIGKKAGLPDNEFAAGAPMISGSSFPIIPVAIGAAALVAVLLLTR